MPEQMRPASNSQAPDPAVTYERTDPKKEAGQGQVTSNAKATPTPAADAMPASVKHAQAGDKQLNGEDEAAIKAKPSEEKPESLGWQKSKG